MCDQSKIDCIGSSKFTTFSGKDRVKGVIVTGGMLDHIIQLRDQVEAVHIRNENTHVGKLFRVRRPNDDTVGRRQPAHALEFLGNILIVPKGSGNGTGSREIRDGIVQDAVTEGFSPARGFVSRSSRGGFRVNQSQIGIDDDTVSHGKRVKLRKSLFQKGNDRWVSNWGRKAHKNVNTNRTAPVDAVGDHKVGVPLPSVTVTGICG